MLNQHSIVENKLWELLTEISSGLLVDDVLDRMYDNFRSIIPYNRLSCALLSEDGCTLTQAWFRSDADEVQLKRGFQARIDDSSLQSVLATGLPRSLNDLEAYLAEHPESHSTRLMVREGMRSSFTCPLKIKDRNIGFLFFTSRSKNTYQHLHQDIFLKISRQIALLIEQQKLYQTLRENEEGKFKAIVSTTMEGFLIVDTQGRFIDVNNAYCELTGYSRDELLNMHIYEIETNETPDEVAHHIQKVMVTGQDHFETRHRCKNGHLIDIEISVNFINIDGGRMFSFLRDITQRNRNNDDLKLKALLLDNVSDLIFLIAPDGHLKYVNDAACKTLGYTRQELLQLTLQDLDTPEHAAQIEGRIEKLMREGYASFDSAMRRKDGSILPLAVNSRSIESGNEKLLLSIARDLTEWLRVQHTMQQWFDAFYHANIGMGIGDAVTNQIIACNPFFARLLGYTPEELSGYPIPEIYTPSERKRISTIIEKLYQYGQSQFESVLLRKDGSELTVQIDLVGIRDANGQPQYRVATIQDITERKRISAELEIAASVQQAIGEAVMIADVNNRIIMVNPAFTKVTGYTSQEAVGQKTSLLKSGRQDMLFYQRMWHALKTTGHWQGEIWNKRKNGEIYPEWISIYTINDAAGNVLRRIAMFSDITDQKRAEERIEYLAHFDQLTGLPNRTMLKDRFNFALSLAHRDNRHLAVLFLDLDHFKNINDTLGHSIGDQLLMEISSRLIAAIRVEDTVSRLGGDEFIFILPGVDANGAAHVATKLIDVISEPFLVEQHELISTASIGIAIYPTDGTDSETLSKNADAAMYQVKQEGRNSYRFFTQAMQTNTARKLLLNNALRHALAREQFQLHYQPQISIEDGRIIGVEALLRWQHPDLGMISPAEFIPVAEHSGQIISIGEWVLQTAARQMKSWLERGLPNMTVAVNLSAVQFRQANLPQTVADVLLETGLPPACLELELTEAVAMDDPLSAISIMDKLNQLGIHMSIDDFGTGYSSLSYLKRFKAYKLKIDQSFVRDISSDPEDKAIVSAIINMAASLGMKTIAEGVETSAQLNYLRLQGCNEVQGYYFSKPLKADQLEEYVRRMS